MIKNFLPVILLIGLLGFNDQLIGQVVINEFSAANTNTIADNYGEFEDWIELYNTTGLMVDISGYHLSDQADNPTKWAFPAGTTINAMSRLVVHASGKDTEIGGQLHTNFKLTQTKGTEVVLLADGTGVVIDQLDLNGLLVTKENHSYGRTSDGAGQWGVFDDPTPGGSNVAANAYNGYTPKPVLSIAAGYKNAPINVAISCTDATAEIRYTTDGSNPTAASSLYTGPISIGSTTVLKAICISANPSDLSSFVETNTYFFGADQHNVKVISIAGDDIQSLLDGNQFNPTASFELFNEDQTMLLDEAVGEFNEHGNDSWAYPQRGIDYITRDQFGYNYAIQNQIFDYSDRDEFQRLILKSAASDNYPFEGGGAHIRDAYVHTLSQAADLELDERTYEPCILYVNGQYWGVYEIREKVDDADYTDYYYDQDENNLYLIQTWGGTWSDFGGAAAIADYDDIRNFIINNDMTIPANYEIAEDRVNFNSMIDYVLLNSFIVNADWLVWNTIWWRGLDPDGDKKKWRFGLWDMDATFNHYANFTGIPDQSANADPCDVQLPQISDPEMHLDMFNSLMENQEFADLYVNRYAYLLNNYFSCQYMVAFLDNMVAEIAPEMTRHCARWGGTVGEWQSNVQNVRDFILARCDETIDTGIVDCYDVEPPTNLTLEIAEPGSGSILLNGENVIPPITYEYFGGVNMIIEADPEDGYTFDYWLITDQNGVETILEEDSTSFLFTGNMTVEAFYIADLINFTLLVVPDQLGEVVIDGTTVVNGFWTDSVPENEEMQFEAQNNNGLMLFHHWSFVDGTPIPNDTDPILNIIPTDGDSLIAHFYQGYLLTIAVDPSGSGTIVYNGQNISSFPFIDTLFIGETVSISILPENGFSFVNWDVAGVALSNTTSTSINFNIGPSNIDLIAQLNNQVQVVFDVNDPSYGNIILDGTELSSLPYSNVFAANTLIELEAQPLTGYVFDHWELSNHSLSPDMNASIVSTSITAVDTITAIFVPESYEVTLVYDPNLGYVIINGVVDTDGSATIPITYGQSIEIEAIPSSEQVFAGWVIDGFDQNGSLLNTLLQLSGTGNGTITAGFEAKPEDCYFVFPSAFSPNGDGLNDQFKPVIMNCEVLNYHLNIYDRWGKQIFSTIDVNAGWNGLLNGEESGIATYVFEAGYNIIEDGITLAKKQKGNFIIIK